MEYIFHKNNSKPFNIDKQKSQTCYLLDEDWKHPESSTIFEGSHLSNKDIRTQCVNWLYDIVFDTCHKKLTILCSVIDLFDRVVESINFLNVRYLQLIGCVCILLVSKNECDPCEYILRIKDIISLTHNMYSHSEILFMEHLILEHINWYISNRYTIVWFVHYFNKKEMTPEIENRIIVCYLSGIYRTENPEKLAYKCMRKLRQYKIISH